VLVAARVVLAVTPVVDAPFVAAAAAVNNVKTKASEKADFKTNPP